MAPNWQIMFHSCEWHQHVKKQPFFLPVLARLEMKLLPSYLEWRQMLIFIYHFHPKHKIHSNMDFFIQICSFSFKSSEFLMGRKTLWRFFYYNFRNIVLDSHFWKKKIATLAINRLRKKGWWRSVNFRTNSSRPQLLLTAPHVLLNSSYMQLLHEYTWYTTLASPNHHFTDTHVARALYHT
jgi:hypothetical protein